MRHTIIDQYECAYGRLGEIIVGRTDVMLKGVARAIVVSLSLTEIR